MARQVEILTKGLAPNGEISKGPLLTKALTEYSELLTPWAASVANYMLSDAARRNAKVWEKNSKELSIALRAEIKYAPTGALFQQLLQENVGLIKSIPLEAAKRVHDLTTQGLVDSRRAAEIAKEIMLTGQVSKSKAELIAVTEVARTSSLLTEARARYVGSEGYIWRTSKDGRVRDSHAEMEGKYVRWDTKPKLSDGTVTHAGQIYRCRCYPEPVIPDF